MDFAEKVYEKSDSIVYRRIADEFILVPIRQNAGDLESIFTLNETAAFIWELIDGKRSVREIGEMIVDQYEIEYEEAERDLIQHMRQLEYIKSIIKV